MKKSYEYFLVLAKTLHFTRAANQLFITQQALSDQINKIEKELGAQLFVRRPKLKLTPAGQLLEKTLLQIQMVEKNFDAQLGNILNTEKGTINIGMHNARAAIIFSLILREFHERYPNVQINIISEQTSNYIKLLEDGHIDFFYGINAYVEGGGILEKKTIAYEPMYFVVHKDVLHQKFGDCFGEELNRLKTGVDLNEFLDIPFIFSGKISQGQAAVEKYLNNAGISINPCLVFNDYSSQYKLLSKIKGACFCYKMMLGEISAYNATHVGEDQLYYFPLKNRKDCMLELSLIKYKDTFFFPYTQYLYDLIIKKGALLLKEL